MSGAYAAGKVRGHLLAMNLLLPCCAENGAKYRQFSSLPVYQRRLNLFVFEGFDGVHAGSTVGGKGPENDTDGSGGGQRNDERPRADGNRE